MVECCTGHNAYMPFIVISSSRWNTWSRARAKLIGWISSLAMQRDRSTAFVCTRIVLDPNQVTSVTQSEVDEVFSKNSSRVCLKGNAENWWYLTTNSNRLDQLWWSVYSECPRCFWLMTWQGLPCTQWTLAGQVQTPGGHCSWRIGGPSWKFCVQSFWFMNSIASPLASSRRFWTWSGVLWSTVSNAKLNSRRNNNAHLISVRDWLNWSHHSQQ